MYPSKLSILALRIPPNIPVFWCHPELSVSHFGCFPDLSTPMKLRAQIPDDVQGENTDPTLVGSTTSLLYNVFIISVSCDVLKNSGIEL